jgi:hypothetical protein
LNVPGKSSDFDLACRGSSRAGVAAFVLSFGMHFNFIAFAIKKHLLSLKNSVFKVVTQPLGFLGKLGNESTHEKRFVTIKL